MAGKKKSGSIQHKVKYQTYRAAGRRESNRAAHIVKYIMKGKDAFVRAKQVLTQLTPPKESDRVRMLLKARSISV